MSLYKYPKPTLEKTGEKWNGGELVFFPVSYRYNGGTVIDGKWYEGYSVPKPAIPKGYELFSIHCGLELNARPPTQTMCLRKKKRK